MAQLSTSAILEPTLLEPVYKVLTKMFEERVTVTKKVPKGDIPINTRGARIPLEVYPTASFGWFVEAGSYAVPDTVYDIEMKSFPARVSAGFNFSGTWLREKQGQTAIVKGLASELAKHQKTALKKLEQAFCATQTGEVAVVVSSASPAVTFATTFAQGSLWSNRKIIPKGRYQFFSSAGSQRQGGISSPFTCVCSLTTPPVRSTGVATFDQIPNNLAATDIAVYEGSFNNAALGLKDIIANTGTIQALARATFPEALNAAVEDAGGSTIGVTRLEKQKNALLWRIEDKVKLGLLSAYTQKEKYKGQGYGLIRYANGAGTQVRQDFPDVQFYDWDWDEAVDIDEDRIYGMKWDELMRLDLKPFGPYDEDGLPWRLFFSNNSGQDQFVGWYGWEGRDWPRPLATTVRAFPLIDLDGENPNRAQAEALPLAA